MPPPSPTISTQLADAPQVANAIMARQPIVNTRREVFGYELFDRTTPSHAHTAASDAALLIRALSYTGPTTLVGDKTVFINCTLASLNSGHLELIHPGKVVLEIPTLNAKATPEQVAGYITTFTQLRARGFRLAFDQTLLRRSHAGWLPLAAFIKLDTGQLPARQIQALVKFTRQHTRAEIVAEKVETQAQFEAMRALGITLFQGFWFAQPDVLHAAMVRPAQATVLQLMALLGRQAEIGEIEVLLQHDPILAYHLLRFLHSTGFDLPAEVCDLRQAVLTLGLQKLLRWASLLATTADPSPRLPLRLEAVVRSRLMELLAQELLTPKESKQAMLVGLFSLLDHMLDLPMVRALEAISLPQPVRDALLYRSGVFAPLLTLAQACEQADEQMFAQSAQALQLSNHQVNWAHLQALAWAQTQTNLPPESRSTSPTSLGAAATAVQTQASSPNQAELWLTAASHRQSE